MKILQIIYSLASGGAERFVVDLCNRLSMNTNDEIVLVTICDEAIESNVHYLRDLSENVRFINLHCSTSLSYNSIWQLFKLIIKESPDIVHCHSNLLLLYLPAFLYRRPKYVHTLHSLAHFCMGGKWQYYFNKFIYRNHVQGVAISKECLQSYIDLYKNNCALLITNGREPLKVTEEFPRIKEYVESIKSSELTPVFIHVARNHPVKNQQMLFSVFERLEKDHIDFQLLVLGSGHEEREKYYAQNKHIHILGEHNNIGDYMQCSDYFVLTSKLEGLPLTLLEAMSMGVIPICTPAGGIVDVIEDGKNGYITKGFTEIEYYEKVKSVIMIDNKISSTLIKQDFDNKYSMEICASNYYQLYRSLYNNKI